MSWSLGTGSPISFQCSRCRRSSMVGGCRRYVYMATGYGETRCKHEQRRTGRTKPHKGNIGLRMLKVSHEYVCECGFTGWSRHIDVVRCPLVADAVQNPPPSA